MNKNLKEKILELRLQGKSYNEICKELDCSKSAVTYHCGEGQKEKSAKRQRELRKDLVILQRVQKFKTRKITDKTRDFQRREGRKLKNKQEQNFHYKDVIEKFGFKTKCYLTGREIDLSKPGDYQFDHIVPPSKGGSNDLDNLGILCKEANTSKSDLLVEELFELCKEILEHNGYKVEKI